MVSGDSAPSGVMQPPISWAQRHNLIFLTINVEDCREPDIKLEETRLHFRGVAGADKRVFETDLELYGEVNPETSKQQVSDRNVQLVLMRKEEGEYWPRLLKSSAKVHWLKIDFGKWRDEDDSEDEREGESSEDMNLEAMMRQMGGLGGGAGDGSKPNMDDLSDSDDEDDAEPLPDLEQ